MLPDHTLHRAMLAGELQRRKTRNRRYSLRSFATLLGVSAGDLSRVLGGKMVPSLKTGEKMAKALSLSPEETDNFLESIAEDRKHLNLAKRAAKSEAVPLKELDAGVFDVVNNWYHLAILELTYVEDFSSDPAWIAKALGISALEARRAIDQLKYLGLLADKDGRLVKKDRKISNRDKHSVSTPTIRRQLRQIFERAVTSMEHDPIDERCMLGMCLPVDESKMPLIKKMTEDFIHEVLKVASTGKPTRVHQMAVGFYPLQTKPEQAKPTRSLPC